MASIPVNPEIFKLLKQAYSEKFGSSPRSLINRLNNAFKEEIGSESENLIAERTIRSFFNSTERSRILEKNLNYFCYVLLDQPSYQEAVRQLAHTQLANDWLTPYWNHLARKCSTMKILDMNEPISINNIYVKFQILKNIQGRRQQTINLLLDCLDSKEENQNYRRLPFSGNEMHIPALEAVMRYRKLMILGKPGAGKTTFLKYLAMNFSMEESTDKIIPIFIRLRDIYDDENFSSLTNVVVKEFTDRIPNSEYKVRELLQNGECFILLDGLDEVKVDKKNENIYNIYKEIDNLVDIFPENRFIITCRTTASDYVFNNFNEVEIADFEGMEIEAFARNWFRERGEAQTCDVFLKKLEDNEAVKELATNPLLLTILCLTFEDTYDFSLNRYDIYKDAVDTLLRKWDASRRIERKSSLNISQQRKINMFSRIAYQGLDNNKPLKVLWHQWELLEQISDFMQNITTDVDSEQVLKLIESNYGLLIQQAKNIYSFSHLTFQEYFAAQYVVENREREFLNNFVKTKLTTKRWREVFILVTERLSSADEFFILMFRCVDNIVKDSYVLQNMLSWLDRMTTLSGIGTSGWRAYYLAIDLDVNLYTSRDIEIDRAIFAKFATYIKNFNIKRKQLTPPQPRSLLISRLAAIHALAEDMSNEATRNSYISLSSRTFSSQMLKISEDIEVDITEKLNEAIEKAQEINDTLLTEALIEFQKSCPSSTASADDWQKWSEDLRQAMLNYLDVGYQIELDEQDIKLLYDYIYANHLLLECISGENYSSKELREQIVDNMLLPADKIPSSLL